MPPTTNSAMESAKKAKWKNLAKILMEMTDVGPSISEAVQNLLVAIDYKDTVLEASSLVALKSAFRDIIQSCIDTAVGKFEEPKQCLEDVLNLMHEECCYEDEEVNAINDTLKEAIQYMDHFLRRLTDMQKAAMALQRDGHEFHNLTEIQFEIDAIKTMRDRILCARPKHGSERPAIDKDMVARSRAADNRGEAKSIADLLSCFQADSSAK